MGIRCSGIGLQHSGRTRIRAFTFTHLQRMRARTTRMRRFMPACMRVHQKNARTHRTQVQIHACMRACTRTCTHARSWAQTHACMHTCFRDQMHNLKSRSCSSQDICSCVQTFVRLSKIVCVADVCSRVQTFLRLSKFDLVLCESPFSRANACQTLKSRSCANVCQTFVKRLSDSQELIPCIARAHGLLLPSNTQSRMHACRCSLTYACSYTCTCASSMVPLAVEER